MKIPQQYLPVMPYLILNKANDFLEFSKTVLGAKEQLIVPGKNNSVMHGEIRIQDAVVMFAQANDTWHQKTCGMFLFIEKIDDVFNLAIQKGSKILKNPGQEEYGYTAGFEDPFGNQWWITEPLRE
ncbi:VOC family protein [Flavobacterium lindanitolerans]|uniref:Glyoxalase superfamily protein PhnB n=1 Tax=Flavobacterium lindanitolerans TaxID=428988 RepID=A0A497TYE2_9FLAO|nr:VOC family protein [Flavobacterium lindanitolerans]PKW29881.1 putative glyoxalase superfamily protein PhnB [Flavobacterium lindanitolerans]RLJ24221.1 putative glyoxalase superfamily protein PhnB [Flavobacterium lindanitolerans]